MRNREKGRKSGTAPAEGERRAVSGFRHQYEMAASIILPYLRDGTLKWIRIADPEAGRVDDFQVGSESRVDAFQVKWSQFGGPFTFNDLVREGPHSPSLLRQLADGWTRLRGAHPGQRVVVHLVTNQVPSVHDRVPTGHAKPTPGHFAGFVAQAWDMFRALPSRGVPHAWGAAWEALRQRITLAKDTFGEFVCDCELEWGRQVAGVRTLPTREQESFKNDLRQLAQFLETAVADKTRIIELDRDRLLNGLGWRARVEFKSRHEFPVVEKLYQSVQPTVLELEKSLAVLHGGYIAVVGTPGSGKSTLLTMVLRSRPERVVRYYAFVPDSHDPSVLRGESVNFLHDVVLDLERMGFRAGQGLLQFDRDDLLDRLHAQLQLLHDDWQRTGRATLILVDGLDHIGREAKPERSLILDLPQPEQVPEGVFFVLGSQTDLPLGDRIQCEVRKPERRVEMRPLSREAVFRIAGSSGVAAFLSEEQKEQIYTLSDGHPLYLRYLLNRLADVDGTTTVQSVLDSAEAYRGNIGRDYYTYWKQVEPEPELAQLLALLCRMRTVIDLDWVRTWANSSALAKLIRLFGHYFRREADSRWYFFHDSFRQFLVRKTGESSRGVWSPAQDCDFHRQIAEICSRQASESPWAWEELYHWARAEDHKAAVDRAQPQWFESQFMAFRPIEAVESDILLAIRSAEVLQDPMALARLILAGAEMTQRSWHLERTSFLSLLLELGQKQGAVDYLRDGTRLRVSPGVAGSHAGGDLSALRISLEFKAIGMLEEAQRLFALAEPLALLSSPSPLADDPQRASEDLLEAWAEIAIDFREPREVIQTIQRIRKEADRFRQVSADDATRNFRDRMLFSVGVGLLRAQRWDDLAALRKEFEQDGKEGIEWWFWLLRSAWRDRASAGDKARAQGLVKEALALVEHHEIGRSPEAKVALAEAALRILGDKSLARSLVATVSQPQLRTDVYTAEGGLQPFFQRFRLNRLLHALGAGHAPSEIVPGSPDPRCQGTIYFERALCVIGEIWGMKWRGQLLTPGDVSLRAFPLLRLFNRELSNDEYTSWYAPRAARGEFYSLLVDATAQHGPEAVNALREDFSKEWSYPQNGRYWPSDVRRNVVLAFARAGADRQWAFRQLAEIEKTMLKPQDVSGRMDECLKQAQAWVALNEEASARASLKQFLKASFGVGYRKDYQFDEWMEWLDQANAVMPEEVPKRVGWFARAVVSLEESTEGKAAKYAAETLLKVAFRWSPRRSIRLLHWFVTQRVVWYEDALEAIILSALQGDAPPVDLLLDFVTDAFLPITTSSSPGLVECLIAATARHQGHARAVDAARRLLDAIQTWALPSKRPKWRRGLALGLRKIGVDPRLVGIDVTDLAPDKDERQSSGWLRLKDGAILSTLDVQASVNSLTALRKLMESEADNCYFDWQPVVASVLQTLDRDGMQSAVDLLSGPRRSPQYMTVLARRLRELGETEGAWRVAEEAVRCSERWGWDRRYDGTRLAAFRALVGVDATRARPLVYRQLVSDLTVNFALAGNIALNLHEFLSLLTDVVPVAAMWPSVERYIHRLFETSALPPDGPADLNETPPLDTAAHALTDLLLSHADHRVTALANSSKRCLRNCLLRGDRFILEAASEALEDGEGLQESVLMVLEALGSGNPGAIAGLGDRILRLLTARNYAVRKAAALIAKRLGLPPVRKETSTVHLPEAYQLVIPETHDGFVVQSREPLPSGLLASDPLELVRPWEPIFAMVAQESQLPLQNILHRASQIMRDLAPECSWSAEGERTLRRELDSASLRLTFRKPRAIIAQRALFHVIGELIDAGRLGGGNLRRLEPAMRFYDPAMLLRDPVTRPAEILPIAGREKFGGKDETWLNGVAAAAPCAVRKMADGRTVLAEETKLKRLDWETATERRLSSLHWVSSSAERDSEELFGRVFNAQVNRYSKLGEEEVEKSPVIRHDAYSYDSPGVHWLALNPCVGRQCGWKISNTDHFRWIDDNEGTMVESIWWVDGLVDQSPPHFEEEVGEGWLVVASAEAVSAIEASCGAMKRRIKVTRSYVDKGEIHARSALAEEN